MAVERVEVARLDINVSDLIKNTSAVKKEIEDLKKSQRDLSKEIANGNEEAGTSYVKNQLKLKQLSDAYRDNMKALAQQSQALQDSEAKTDLLTMAQNKNISSINEARGNLAVLNRLRNDVNTTTEEGRQALLELNDAIDANNAYIKENGDAYLKQKINIGNYTESINESFQSLNIFNGGLTGFVARSEEAGGAGKLLSAGFSGITAGIFGMVKAGLAFIATPIGIVITALAIAVGVVVGAFKFMVSSMKSTEAGSNKLAMVTAKISGAMSTLGKILKPVAEFLFNTFVNAFEAVIAVGEKAIEIYRDVAEALGMDGVAQAVDDVTDAIKKNSANAMALEKAEQNLQKAQRDGIALQLQYQLVAEKLRQQRDDESKSIDDRIIANRALGRVLKEQSEAELVEAKKQLTVALLRIQYEGKNTEALNAKAEAMKNIFDIEERIAGQFSEQLANENSLRKEQADKMKELADAEKARQAEALAQALAVSTARLNLWKSEAGFRAKSMAEALTLEEKYRDQRLKIAQDEFNASKKTEADKLKLQTARNEANNDLAKAQIDATVKNADREVQIYKDATAKRLTENNFLSESILAQETARINELARREEENAKLKLEKQVINLQEYNDLVDTINDEAQAKRDALAIEREQAKKDKELIDLENKAVVEAENFELSLEIERERNAIRMEEELKQAQLTGANTQLIKDKYAKLDLDLEKTVKKQKRDIYAQTFGELASILGEHSTASKALQLAEATMNTYNGVTQVWASDSILPEPLATIQKGVSTGVVLASGLSAVKKISGTSVKYERGGIQRIGGKDHIAGGTKFYGSDGSRFEAQRGEGLGILNRNAFSSFMRFNDAFINNPNGFTEAGGSISESLNSGTDIEAIARMTIEAVRAMPAPVAVIEDLDYGLREKIKIDSAGDLF